MFISAMPLTPLACDSPRAVSIGSFTPQLTALLKAAHDALDSGKRCLHFFRNRPLCCLRIFQDDAQDRFFIGVIGFNFGVIGVTLFGVNDTIFNIRVLMIITI